MPEAHVAVEEDVWRTEHRHVDGKIRSSEPRDQIQVENPDAESGTSDDAVEKRLTKNDSLLHFRVSHFESPVYGLLWCKTCFSRIGF